MHAKDASVNDGRETQVVKDFSAVPPNGDATVFAQTFIVKTVDLRNLTRLVIPSNQCDSIWISDLQFQEYVKWTETLNKRHNLTLSARRRRNVSTE